MATLEREFSARWGVDEVFRYFRDGILAGSQGDGRIRLTGITAGCGRLEKLWTYGEEAFLKKLTKLADGFDAAHPQ